jgi:biopolymer transport protein ExbB
LLSILQAAGWPVWPLLICSVLSTAVVIERAFALRQRRIAPAGLLEQTMTQCQSNLPLAQDSKALSEHSLLGQILSQGIEQLRFMPSSNEASLRQRLEAAGKLSCQQMERYLVVLATIASVAPLLGLLGTVVGMIELFGAQAPANQQPAELAHGISVALYNTAFGLMVAIPSLVAWRFFRARVDHFTVQLEFASERFMQHLQLLQRAR